MFAVAVFGYGGGGKIPEGATSRYSDCKYKESCPYSAFNIYLNDEYKRLAALARHGRPGISKEEITGQLHKILP